MNYAENKLIKTDEEFFTVDSLAQILGVDPSTIRRDIRKGTLTGIKISGVYLVFLSDALKYVDKFN